MRMYLGKFNRMPCLTGRRTPNGSVCITGLSGTGKTSRMNQIELESVRQGETLIVIDLHKTHGDGQIFPLVQSEYLKYVNRIRAVSDGLGLGILQAVHTSEGEETFVELVNSAVQALSAKQRMGARQIGILRKAVISAIESRNRYCDEAEAIKAALLQLEGESSEAVYEKLWVLLNSGCLKSASKMLEAGRINILDLTGTDMLTQSVLAELILSTIWRRVRFHEKEKRRQILIVIDEFQNLSAKMGAPLMRLLTEGRRFGISLLLATQSLEIFPSEIQPVLSQTATRLYFRPTDNEVKKIAKNISADSAAEWVKTLKNLKVGESVAVGDLEVAGREIRRPILLK